MVGKNWDEREHHLEQRRREALIKRAEPYLGAFSDISLKDSPEPTKLDHEYEIDYLKSVLDECHGTIDGLVARICELERKVSGLVNQNGVLFMQTMIAQNRENVRKLEEIFGIDADARFDPSESEGLLESYSDAKASVEWVRSVRDDY